MMYFVLFCIYWMWTLVSYVYDIRAASEMSNFFGEEIRISDVCFLMSLISTLLCDVCICFRMNFQGCNGVLLWTD